MVTDNGADLGVLFDTDVDRSAVVAADGAPINSNRYIALMSYIALRCVTRIIHHMHTPDLLICPTGYRPTRLEFHAWRQQWQCAAWTGIRSIDLPSDRFDRKYPGSTVVTDSVTSNGLSEYISGLGGHHFRYRRGYKNVINKGVELNNRGTNCQLMMETRCASALHTLWQNCMVYAIVSSD